MNPSTAFVFIAKGSRNEPAESYPGNLNSSSTWQAVWLLFGSMSDPPGSIYTAPIIAQFCKRRLTESTVIFQIPWGILSRVSYEIESYLNKLIFSQSSIWLIFVNRVLHKSVLWFHFRASLRISDISPNKNRLLFFEVIQENIQLLMRN